MQKLRQSVSLDNKLHRIYVLIFGESLGELGNAVEALACGSCSQNISRSSKLVFL